MGYGKRAMDQLVAFYEGRIPNLGEDKPVAKAGHGSAPDTLEPRRELPPLLTRLSEERADPLDYIGVSFGVTGPLFKFWKTCGFTPVYLRQTQVCTRMPGELWVKPVWTGGLGRDASRIILPSYWSHDLGRVNLAWSESCQMLT